MTIDLTGHYIVRAYDGIDWRYVADDGTMTYRKSDARGFDTADDADKEASYLTRHHGVRTEIKWRGSAKQ